ncbi:MAG TPA: DUF1800 domain-containing protein [Luteitalea sp.]|nr:DUF1800 domain-containing protein [Luteitalea sp.]
MPGSTKLKQASPARFGVQTMRKTRPILRFAVVALPVLATFGLTPAAAPSLATVDAIHVLNRLTFGATLGELARLESAGLRGWLDAQMKTARTPDAPLEARLASLTTLTLSPAQLAEIYNRPAIERRRAARGSNAGGAGTQVDGQSAASRDGAAPAMDPGARLAVRRALTELTTQKILRAATAERQLEEVLVDFWFNHFNVYAGKGPVRQYVADFERTAIRPHVFGSFRDMLGAVAGHPAMLFYLDNWQSSAPGTRTMRGASGLNENYARELLELHTLGVDGGYTQHDIVEVARAFTGWSIRAPRVGGSAFYDRRRHDEGVKVVLGERLPANGGQRDGERVLDLVAAHPATARHIALKLARRFVADDPPPALVARVAARFTATHGDLRATVESLVLSPEFVDDTSRWAKVKTPVDFVVSALRVLDADVTQGRAIGEQLRTLGMLPYFAQPPTGYSDRGESWTTAGALVQRMNLALAVTQDRLPGVSIAALPATAPGPDAVATLAHALVLRELSPATMKTVQRGRTTTEMAALILGSPEFQRK